MSSSLPAKKDLSIGCFVRINPRSDRSRKKIIEGRVKAILTNADFHPHGILVELDCGEIGRVKSIELANTKKDIYEPSVERNSEALVDFFNPSEPNDSTAINELIYAGESHFVEHKTSCLWSLSLTATDIKQKELVEYGINTSKVIIAKALAGFLNADGGFLIIGIKELKDSDSVKITGIDSEFHKLEDKTVDGYRRMILDKILKLYFPSFVFNRINDYIQIFIHEIENENICILRVNKSDRRVFLRINNKDLFFVRIDASTREIKGEEILDYCEKRFN